MNGYNFTERVRKVLAFAREEAARLHHEYVAPQHILLALLREGEGVASVMIENCGADPNALIDAIETRVERGNSSRRVGPDLPFTSRAKKILELAMLEARSHDHRYVGTEHLLMGVLREEQNMAAHVLTDAGVTVETARAAMFTILGEPLTETIPEERGGDLVAQPVSPYAPERLRRVFESAFSIAGSLGATEISPVHMALALLQHRDGAGNAALDLLHLDRHAAIESLQQIAAHDNGPEVGPETTLRPGTLLLGVDLRMRKEQRALGAVAPGSQHLLLALLGEQTIADIFAEQGAPVEKIREEVRRISG
jgi:ATP-dependent Clp protease ATP-binding subunit ClpA